MYISERCFEASVLAIFVGPLSDFLRECLAVARFRKDTEEPHSWNLPKSLRPGLEEEPGHCWTTTKPGLGFRGA